MAPLSASRRSAEVGLSGGGGGSTYVVEVFLADGSDLSARVNLGSQGDTMNLQGHEPRGYPGSAADCIDLSAWQIEGLFLCVWCAGLSSKSMQLFGELAAGPAYRSPVTFPLTHSTDGLTSFAYLSAMSCFSAVTATWVPASRPAGEVSLLEYSAVCQPAWRTSWSSSC